MDIVRLLAALKLPAEAVAFIAVAADMVQRVTNNPLLPNPSPSVAELTNDLANLRSAQANRKQGEAAMKARNDAMRVMRRALQNLRQFVQNTADNDPEHAATIIESAGMKVRVRPVRTKPDFEIRQGSIAGLVSTHVKSRGQSATYWVAFSTDQKSWTVCPPARLANGSVANLTPGTTYYFRYQVLTREGMSDWSQVVSFMVK